MDKIIETERLFLRNHSLDDFDSMCCLFMDKTEMYYLPELFCDTKEEVMANLQNSIYQENLSINERFEYFYAIEEKASDKYCGEVGITLETVQSDKRRLADLGYFMLSDFRGKGYMTEAVTQLIDFTFNNLPVQKIKTGCLQENKKSERVMIKTGLQKEGLLLKHQFHNEEWKNRLLYGLCFDEWRSQQQNK